MTTSTQVREHLRQARLHVALWEELHTEFLDSREERLSQEEEW